jgi:hypothetical protein
MTISMFLFGWPNSYSVVCLTGWNTGVASIGHGDTHNIGCHEIPRFSDSHTLTFLEFLFLGFWVLSLARPPDPLARIFA